MSVLSKIFAILMCFVAFSECRVCPTIDIRNHPHNLRVLRGCTRIEGHLKIVLIERAEAYTDFEHIFPELREIRDYLLLFRVMQLDTLGRMFPNLRSIGGENLFHGFALVVYDMEHLQEIGLTSLQHIGRGGVKVDLSPNVCYVHTVNWKSLGASRLDFDNTTTSACKDEVCPNECGGYCWNNVECQSQSRKEYCDKYMDGEECVSKCPPPKVTNKETRTCMTEEECSTMLNGGWWNFNGTCINECPVYYKRDRDVKGGCRYVGPASPKMCSGTVVSTSDMLEQMEGCTFINGSLEIRILDSTPERNLERYLGNIVSISGYLKIGRLQSITSLGFLKNLTTIKGEQLDNNRYSLFVYENENLRKLWDFSDDFKLTILNGTMAFHDNPQLCLREIEKLEQTDGIRNKTDMQMSKYSNGYKSSCHQKNLTVKITETNPTNVTMVWERESLADDEVLLGYTVYYSEEENAQFWSDNEDGCNKYSWNGVFVRENTAQLKDLIPYTRYAYYIKIYTALKQGQQTPQYAFMTASSEPSEPLGLTAEAVSDSTIVLKWEPPRYTNGDLSHYTIYMYIEEDYSPTIRQRNYCENPHVFDIEEPSTPTNTSLNTTKADNCTCPVKTYTSLFTEELSCNEGSSDLENCIKTVYHQQIPSPFMTRIFQKREIVSSRTDIQEYTVPANETTYEFNNLKHFTLYVFQLKGCNTWRNRETEKIECGYTQMVSQRTKKKEDADIVRELSVYVDSDGAHVNWDKPSESNSVLVAYQIEYKRTDSEHSKPRFECINDKDQKPKHTYKIRLPPGKYSVRVQAVSFAGPGLFSEWRHFEISAPAGSPVAVIVPVVLAIVFVLSFGGVYWWYRRKRARELIHLFASVNPDYAGSRYTEDEWELERSDVEILRELGQGSFGMVYEGTIRSRQYPCAIKTVNESASTASRLEFLNEGAVMKGFSDGYHVVKLLGIVSRGQPPLVVMELMERGDLKSYLRRCREPSQNLTTSEMYRMAAEIADGMAYLSAKKFIHRDLAARNCMVAADRTVKIGDFGMARDVYETDYYRKETVGLLPVRWMAPESLADGVFSTDSDIWSYGVVLWEMATLAEQPYQGMSNEEVFHFVKTRGKLERPTECSDILFEVMDACWSWRPNDRPRFSGVVDRLVDQVGPAFRLVAFCFSRLGLELARTAGARPYNPPALILSEENYFGHYDPSDEEVNLYVRDRDRPVRYLPFQNQRNPSPERVSPGSPSSSYSLNSS
ncbi:insulin-like receptor isoform X2 [Zophobas morio]|uniref:insulin-like receptor isoform X2 n=1 Tax=Zophobas morio TaxID=2755281 RepID=UPI003082DB0D